MSLSCPTNQPSVLSEMQARGRAQFTGRSPKRRCSEIGPEGRGANALVSSPVRIYIAQQHKAALTGVGLRVLLSARGERFAREEPVPQGNIRVVVFREEDQWVAYCLEYDIAAQAPDLETLKRRLEVTISVELDESIRRNGTPFAGIGPAPAYIQDRWKAPPEGFRSSGTARSESATAPKVGYELALCA